LVQDGKLGEIVHAECEYLHPIPTLVFDRKTGQKKWRFTRAPLHYCTHSLGPILDITGDRIVRACGLGQGHRLMPEAPIGGIDLQVALFETAKGMMIKLMRTSVMPRKPALHYYALHGTKGYIESSRHAIGRPGILYIEGEMENPQEIEVPVSDPSLPESARAGGHGTAEFCLVQDFLGSLERGETPRIDVVRGMDITVPGLVAHESAMRNGEWLPVPSLA
jgi:predicted dehydrogenase